MNPNCVKRLRVRLKATDGDSLAKNFGLNIGTDFIFLGITTPLPVGTHVFVEVCFLDGSIALSGRGRLQEIRAQSETQTAGILCDLDWSKDSQGLVDKVLEFRVTAALDALLETPRHSLPAPAPGPDVMNFLGSTDDLMRQIKKSRLASLSQYSTQYAQFDLEYAVDEVTPVPATVPVAKGEPAPLARIELIRRE